jgi:hypothetical protein
MRKRTLLLAAALAALGLPIGDAGALGSRAYRRVGKVGDSKATQYPLGPFPVTPPSDITQVAPVLDETFDPAEWDELSVAGDGRLVAFATTTSDLGLPGQPKRVVVQTVGGASQTLTVSGSLSDQPSIQFDEFGWRCAFRSTATGANGASLIQLHDFRRAPEDPVQETNPIPGVTAAREPALAARSRVRDVGSGIKVHESDARVAFVSTGDLSSGGGLSNPDRLDQLFLWEEQGDRIRQITDNKRTGPKVVDRPTIAKTGDVIFFESTADLTPEAADPLETSRVGNAGGTRQIFRWRRGGVVEQITWFDEDCFCPRTDLNGRFVLFCSRGEPLDGANSDGGFEIFSWSAGTLTQMTQSAVGHNVFPRPTSRMDQFAFYSSCPPPADGGSVGVRSFGATGVAEIGPKPYAYRRGRIDFVHGLSDFSENLVRIAGKTVAGGERTTLQKLPVFTGPPAPGLSIAKMFFAENQLPRRPRGVPKIDQDALPTAVILRASR